MGGDGLRRGGGVTPDEPSTSRTYTEIIYEQFPFYLSIGMSSAEYWTGDPILARYFREAYQLKQEQEDSHAWLQGLYVYEALSVALSNSFRKKGTTAAKYSEQPYLQQKKEKERAAQEDKPDPFEIWMNSLVSKSENSVHPE